MRRALLALALLSFAGGCGGGHAGDGSRDRLKVYFFADPAGVVKSRVERRVHHDGSESLHGVTVEDFRPGFQAVLRVDEQAEIDATGKLVSADAALENTWGAAEQRKRVVFDPANQVVHVQRAAGSVDWPVANDLPWSWYHFGADTVFDLPISSPVAAWVIAKAQTAGDHTHFLLWDALESEDVATAPDADTLHAGVDVIHVGADFIDSIDMGGVGDTLAQTAAVVDPGAVEPVAQEPANVFFPDCTLPGRADEFAVVSSDGTRVRGEVDLPPEAPPFPMVVFNSGTGGADRDQFVGGIPRWACLARPLLDAGIAVVRYDDRGHGATGGDLAAMTFRQRSDDAAAVARYAAGRPELLAGRLYLLGHSEGAAHASEAAIAVPQVAGLILLSGLGTTGEAALHAQQRAVLGRYGLSAPYVEGVIAQSDAVFDEVKTGTWPSATLGGFSVEFWRQFLAFDGAQLAAAAARPTLLFQGTSDWQVLPGNETLLADAITAAGQPDVTVRMLPGDGHFESAAPAGYPATGDEYWIPTGWDEALVSDLILWIRTH